MLFEIILSIVVIFLSIDVISTEDALEVGGLKVRLSLCALLLVSTLLITFLLMAFHYQVVYAFALTNTINKYYYSIWFHELSNLDPSPFTPPNIYFSTISFFPSLATRRPGIFVSRLVNSLLNIISSFLWL
jgi:hypothetical protein